jgi:hypothetical protein
MQNIRLEKSKGKNPRYISQKFDLLLQERTNIDSSIAPLTTPLKPSVSLHSLYKATKPLKENDS